MPVRVTTPFNDDTVFTFYATGEGIGEIAPLLILLCRRSTTRNEQRQRACRYRVQ